MDYKFSVIMPLYNVSSYLSEAIDSVIGQTIGFEDNIQLILVNDGSTDDTERICIRYRNAYPDNIIYIRQANAGVSMARNAGLPYVKGLFVNFLDGDDLWEPDAFELVWNMFETCGESIDVVACRMDYFEGKTGFQRLDYKFRDGDFVCDIFERPTFCQFSVSSSFSRVSAIGDMTFDPRISFGEDAKFINQLILRKEKYGLLRSAIYHIRRRNMATSLTQSKLSKETAYKDTATLYYRFMENLSIEKYGYIIPYIQYALINALKYRVRSAIPEYISSDVRAEYIDMLSDLISKLDDEVICRAKNMYVETKLYFLYIKHGIRTLRKLVEYDDDLVRFNGLMIGHLLRKDCLSINSIKRSLFRTTIKGAVQAPIIIGPLTSFGV